MKFLKPLRLLALITLIIILISPPLFAQNSGIFLSIGGLLNGGLVFGYDYYFSPNFALRAILEIISVSQSGYSGSAIMICAGIQYLFSDFYGFFLGADIGFGTINISGLSISTNLFRFFSGYRFLFNSFYIDAGLTFAVLSLAILSISKAGILIEIGFLF